MGLEHLLSFHVFRFPISVLEYGRFPIAKKEDGWLSKKR